MSRDSLNGISSASHHPYGRSIRQKSLWVKHARSHGCASLVSCSRPRQTLTSPSGPVLVSGTEILEVNPSGYANRSDVQRVISQLRALQAVEEGHNPLVVDWMLH